MHEQALTKKVNNRGQNWSKGLIIYFQGLGKEVDFSKALDIILLLLLLLF